MTAVVRRPAKCHQTAMPANGKSRGISYKWRHFLRGMFGDGYWAHRIPMPIHVFISYSRHDPGDRRAALRRRLSTRLHVTIDRRDLPYGRSGSKSWPFHRRRRHGDCAGEPGLSWLEGLQLGAWGGQRHEQAPCPVAIEPSLPTICPRLSAKSSFCPRQGPSISRFTSRRWRRAEHRPAMDQGAHEARKPRPAMDRAR